MNCEIKSRFLSDLTFRPTLAADVIDNAPTGAPDTVVWTQGFEVRVIAAKQLYVGVCLN